eukprot:m.369907 g.369907  ORF g.369907 m.369907 type:complete len:78 (+) comp16680_c1_seq24:1636-1869(+)
MGDMWVKLCIISRGGLQEHVQGAFDAGLFLGSGRRSRTDSFVVGFDQFPNRSFGKALVDVGVRVTARWQHGLTDWTL